MRCLHQALIKIVRVKYFVLSCRCSLQASHEIDNRGVELNDIIGTSDRPQGGDILLPNLRLIFNYPERTFSICEQHLQGSAIGNFLCKWARFSTNISYNITSRYRSSILMGVILCRLVELPVTRQLTYDRFVESIVEYI